MQTTMDRVSARFDEFSGSEKAMIFSFQIDEGDTGYVFGRFMPSSRILVVREDGEIPSKDEVKSIVSRMVQFEKLCEGNQVLERRNEGRMQMLKEFKTLLEEIEEYYREHVDLFPNQAYAQLKEMTRNLIDLQDEIDKQWEEDQERIQTLFEKKRFTEEDQEELIRSYLEQLQREEDQWKWIDETLGAQREFVQYLIHYTPFWQFKWKKVVHQVKRTLKQLQKDAIDQEDREYVRKSIEMGRICTEEEMEEQYELIVNGE